MIQPKVLYFGTPVALITTVDALGKDNITPVSSAWALGDRLVLGMSVANQGCANLMQTQQAVVNLPDTSLVEAVERIAATTGRREVPEFKTAMGYRFESDKFKLAGLSRRASDLVAPPRIAECPLQIEVRLLASHPATMLQQDADTGLLILECQVLRVHAHDTIVVLGTDYVRTDAWSPLLYVFRHYFSTGARLGRNFRAET